MDEEKIFKLIKKYLTMVMPELKDKDIQPTDSFAKLGLNSIERMEITAKIISELSLEVSTTELFRQATLGDLTKLLDEKKREIN